MTIYKKQPRTLAETSAATVSEASARQSSGLTSLFKGSDACGGCAAHRERASHNG